MARGKQRSFRCKKTGQIFLSARQAAEYAHYSHNWFLEQIDRGETMIGELEFEELKGVVVEIPSGLNTPEFAEAFGLWVTHRKEIKKKLTPTQAKMQIKRLNAMGLQRALVAIEHSIANGYQGIYEPKQSDKPAPVPLPNRPPVVQSQVEPDEFTHQERVENIRRIKEMSRNLASRRVL